MTNHRARRTARSAGLVAVAAAAAFSLTACQSGGKEAAGTATQNSVSASRPTGDGGAPGASSAGAGTARISSRTVAYGAHRIAAQSTSAKAGSPVRTQTLPDGSKAEIYKLGDQHYRAEIVSRDSVLATLETDNTDAGLDANDMFVVLTLGGEVHAWMGGGHQGPGTFKLAGGWTAKVTKLGELRYRAQIIGHDGVAATLNTNQHDVGLDANGIYIVLSDGGIISAHA
ncbi:hypothetical protein [Streptomyces sp. NBC_00388]|uniref:hypothetical protein n=1 Tax=Streptomyces sp. NBC_00388 TaxID=2975735 RepID=UPI002E23FCC6